MTQGNATDAEPGDVVARFSTGREAERFARSQADDACYVIELAGPGHYEVVRIEYGQDGADEDAENEREVADQRTRDGMNVTTWLCGSPPANGQHQRYPGRFLFNLERTYPEFFGDDTLHMFSGSCEFGVSTDFRPETSADIVAPFDAIPRPDGSFAHALADPPYADHYQGEWHGDLPKPKHILREAARLVCPGGLIGILHIIVIPAYKALNVERVALHPVLAGPNNAIRVFNVFRRQSDADSAWRASHPEAWRPACSMLADCACALCMTERDS